MSVDQRIVSRNPATNEPIWSGSLADDAAIAQAVSVATRAQHTWEATPLDARKDIIRAFADQRHIAKMLHALFRRIMANHSGKRAPKSNHSVIKYRRSSTPMINGLRQLRNKSMDASR